MKSNAETLTNKKDANAMYDHSVNGTATTDPNHNSNNGNGEETNRRSFRSSIIGDEMVNQFKRKDHLYRRFSDLNGPAADEAAKLSQVGLSPNDLKLSTRRSHRGSSMIYNGSSPYSSMHSISSTRNNSGRNSYASSHRNSATSPRRMGSSLESVPSAENGARAVAGAEARAAGEAEMSEGNAMHTGTTMPVLESASSESNV